MPEYKFIMTLVKINPLVALVIFCASIFCVGACRSDNSSGSGGTIAKSMILPLTFTLTYQMVSEDVTPQQLIDKSRVSAIADIKQLEAECQISHAQAQANTEAEEAYTKPDAPVREVITIYGNDGNLIAQVTGAGYRYLDVLAGDGQSATILDVNSSAEPSTGSFSRDDIGNAEIYSGPGMFQLEKIPIPGVGLTKSFPLIKDYVQQQIPSGVSLVGLSPLVPHSATKSGQIFFGHSIVTLKRKDNGYYAATDLTFYGKRGPDIQWKFANDERLGDVFIPFIISRTSGGYVQGADGKYTAVTTSVTNYKLLSASPSSLPIEQFNYKYWIKNGCNVTDHTIGKPIVFSYLNNGGSNAEQAHRRDFENQLEESEAKAPPKTDGGHKVESLFLLLAIVATIIWAAIRRSRGIVVK